MHKLKAWGAVCLLPLRGSPEQICLTIGFSRPLPRDGLDVTVGWGGNLEQLGSSQHWSLSFGTQSHLGLGSESRDPKANMNEARRPGLALCFPRVKPASLGFLYPNTVLVVGCDRPVPTAERSTVLLIGIALCRPVLALFTLANRWH